MAKLKSSGIYEYFWNSLSRISIKRIDFGNKEEKNAHDRLVALTVKFEAATARLAGAKIEADARIARQRIAALDAETESLIARLYGLKAEGRGATGS